MTFCASVWRSGGTEALWLATNGFLLGHVEIGAGPGLEARPDGVENSRRAGDVAAGGAQPVLRCQNLEIRIGNGSERGQRDHIAVETICRGGFLGRQRGIAVLAPEIDFISRAERGRVVDHFAAADGQAAGAGARGAGIGLLAVEVQGRQQRRAGDARLRIRLDEPRGGGGDVQIDRLCLLHQRRQFGRPKAAPPVQRRRRADTGRPRVLVTAGNLQRGIGNVLGQDAPRRRRGKHGRPEQVRPTHEPRLCRRNLQPGHRGDASTGTERAILAVRKVRGQSCSATVPVSLGKLRHASRRVRNCRIRHILLGLAKA